MEESVPKKKAAIIEEGPHFDETEVPIVPSEPVAVVTGGRCRWNFGGVAIRPDGAYDGVKAVTVEPCANKAAPKSDWCAEHKCSDCNEHAAITLGRCVKCYGKAYRAS